MGCWWGAETLDPLGESGIIELLFDGGGAPEGHRGGRRSSRGSFARRRAISMAERPLAFMKWNCSVRCIMAGTSIFLSADAAKGRGGWIRI